MPKQTALFPARRPKPGAALVPDGNFPDHPPHGGTLAPPGHRPSCRPARPAGGPDMEMGRMSFDTLITNANLPDGRTSGRSMGT